MHTDQQAPSTEEINAAAATGTTKQSRRNGPDRGLADDSTAELRTLTQPRDIEVRRQLRALREFC